MKLLDKLYINGKWIASDADSYLEIINPATGQKTGKCISGNATDVDKAAKAARAAFGDWSAKSIDDRCNILDNFLKLYKLRQSEVASSVSEEMGMSGSLSQKIHSETIPQLIKETIELARNYDYESVMQDSLIGKEAFGVIGAITPWNNPVYMMMLKVIPALAAGCTVIHKPAEISPSNAYIITQLLHDAGLPPGVFNLVPGKGDEVGATISSHSAIDLVSFTGSTKAGKAVAKGAAETVKKVILELGGKSACIALTDADIESTVSAVVASVFNNNGQMCGAWTRLLVPATQLKDYESALTKLATQLKTGSPEESTSDNGPLASKQQFETVTDYIKTGIKEGATLICGGLNKPDELNQGYYVLPTIFSDVKNSMRIAQEEIFGPVLCVIPYLDEEEALAFANDSVYGLRGAVFSTDVEHAKAVAKKVRTGQVDINGYKMKTYSPFGGYKQSGYGRCQGVFGFEEFLQVKSIQL